MECATAITELLVADPQELRGVGDTALGRHVRDCTGCRARAQLILAEQERLADALTVVTSGRTRAADAPIAAASGRIRSADAATAAAARRRHSWRRLPRLALLPVAAAAALVITVWPGRHDSEPLPPILLRQERVQEVPVVNAASGRNVAVMRTNDPKITVVWYY